MLAGDAGFADALFVVSLAEVLSCPGDFGVLLTRERHTPTPAEYPPEKMIAAQDTAAARAAITTISRFAC